HQAGKFAPSGRIICFNQDRVYGYGRKPQYYKWTTTLEHQLFAADRNLPEISGPLARDKNARRGASPGAFVSFPVIPKIDPTGKPIAVEAWVKPDKGGNGVVVAHGGPAEGYALFLKKRQPWFSVRSGGKAVDIYAKTRLDSDAWTHVAGVLSPDKGMKLYVNGELVSTGTAHGLLTKNPIQTLDIGSDLKTYVSDAYPEPVSYGGLIDSVRVYHSPVQENDVKTLSLSGAIDAVPVMECTFDGKKLGQDSSPSGMLASASGATIVPGKVGSAARFPSVSSKSVKQKPKRAAGTEVKHHWTRDLPLFVRAMLLTDTHLYMAGPPDLIDEEETFARLAKRDETVEKDLAVQDAALDGEQGAVFYVARIEDGSKIFQATLPSLPTWDGMAAAYGKIYLSTEKGEVICLK
ncbi:MAG: LamG domain-containing protein, partial [Verrucomicrobiota bacterium]